MARIRTIKPEFPQSESVGKLSRDARLLYIQLWTIVDDEGKARAASRMLASLLYPYDDDARGLIDGWLLELERGEHIRRYEVDGAHYLEITKWLEHQKIDRPSKSRLPSFNDGSPITREDSSNVRRASDADLGPSTLDLVPSTSAAGEPPRARAERKSRKGNATPLQDNYALPDAIKAFGLSWNFSTGEIAREHQKFCNHAKQNDRRCVDWIAAERNWLIGAAERMGKSAPAEGGAVSDGLIEVLGQEELDAWDEYGRKKTGKSFPRNSRGGWRFPSRWPPGYEPRAREANVMPPPIRINSMQ